MRLIEIDNSYSPLTMESFNRDLEQGRSWHPKLSREELRKYEKKLARWDREIKRDYIESDIEIPPQFRSDDYDDGLDDDWETESHLLDIELARRGIKQKRKKLPKIGKSKNR